MTGDTGAGWWDIPAGDDADRLEAIRASAAAGSAEWLDPVGDCRWLLDYVARHTGTSGPDPDIPGGELTARLIRAGLTEAAAVRAAETVNKRATAGRSVGDWGFAPLDPQAHITVWVYLNRPAASRDPADLQRLPEIVSTGVHPSVTPAGLVTSVYAEAGVDLAVPDDLSPGDLARVVQHDDGPPR